MRINNLLDYLSIKKSGLFDQEYYLKEYPDVRNADTDPLMHYINNGWKEGRNPSPIFDTENYIESNPVVRQKNINPLIHYIRNQRNTAQKKTSSITVSPASINSTKMGNKTKINLYKNRKGLLNKLIAGWQYLRVNGVKKFFIRILNKLGNPHIKAIRSLNKNKPHADNNPYEAFYKESLTASISSRKSEFVGFNEHIPSNIPSDVKLIAFYLPQFHPIPENDAWWGRGFTEWTNVSKAIPQFVGHYQPRLPGELGFYDLRVPEIQHRQVELAKNYGIYGFCFYFYWFNGKRLLELPLERFVKDPTIEFPFCICWANENWTRRWDGYERDVLIAQDHSPETDLAFIKDVIPLFNHKNYITIDGHPILIVYRLGLFPDPQKTAKLWKEECLAVGLKEPYLIAAQTFGFTDPREVGFDSAVEFPPHNISAECITHKVELLNQNYSGCVYRYTGESSLSELYLNLKHVGYKAFKTVAPGWDNEPRKPGRGNSFILSTPEAYKKWLKTACEITRASSNPEERIVFINAWNEWGEGAYLEPDRKFGYAYLQATHDIVMENSLLTNLTKPHWTILFVLHDAHYGGAQLLIKNIINWLHEHTSLRIKMVFLAGGDLLPQYAHLGEALVLDDLDAFSDEEFITKVINFCDGKPDLIYGNTVTVGKAYRQLKLIGRPIITHIHELEMSINRYASAWIDELVQHSDHFISVSDAVSQNLQDNHEIPTQSISKIYGGIPDEDCRLSAEEKQSLRCKLGLPQDKKVVIGCGRGMPFRKGADLFIEVAKDLQHKLPDETFLIWIGDFDPNEYDDQLGYWRDYQWRLEKEKNIKFLGFQTNTRDYLQADDLFLLTSREDPFPLVMLEAAQSGLPVICFEQSGGAPEFVMNEAGIVVPFCDVEKMVEASLHILSDDTLRQLMGEKGREKVNRLHTIDTVASKILTVCRQVAKMNPVISVIVPNYNHAKYLPDRLESILNQTFRDFEIIILDDASTDNSLEIIQDYSDRVDIKVVKSSSNSGSPFHQWITGLEMAQSDLIWIAESDDKCENIFLQSLLPAFSDKNVKLAYTNSWIIDSNGQVMGDYLSTDYLKDLSTTKWNSRYVRTAEEEINDGLGVKNTILNISSAIFRKPQFDQSFYGKLVSMRYAGDWLFIINLIRGGFVYYEAQKLNYHRRHVESVIGELIKNNRVDGFYKEIATVQRSVCELYRFDPAFLDKWISYHQKQWKEFHPNRKFEEFTVLFPYEEIISLIKELRRK